MWFIHLCWLSPVAGLRFYSGQEVEEGCSCRKRSSKEGLAAGGLAHTCRARTQRGRQKDWQFAESPGYAGRPCLKERGGGKTIGQSITEKEKEENVHYSKGD